MKAVLMSALAVWRVPALTVDANPASSQHRIASEEPCEECLPTRSPPLAGHPTSCVSGTDPLHSADVRAEVPSQRTAY